MCAEVDTSIWGWTAEEERERDSGIRQLKKREGDSGAGQLKETEILELDS